MKHVFISYSRHDQELVDKIICALADAGIKVWIDREGIPGGVKWRRQIVDAIEAADAVLLALSPHSVLSDNVRKELDLTEEFKKTILPVEITSTPIPKDMSYQLAGLQKIDLTTNFDAGARRLLQALRLPSKNTQRVDKISDSPAIGNQTPNNSATRRIKHQRDSKATTPESLHERGQNLYSAGNHEKALQCFREAAEREHAPSQNALGVMYWQGYGTVVDYSEAVKWFRCAAEQGEVWAYLNLGYMFRGGMGVPEDMSQAARYFRMAAEEGLAEAQGMLGVLYLIGRGVDTDYHEAAKWYRRAADQGNATAMGNLAEIYQKGLGVPQDRAEAEKWQRKKAVQIEKDKKARSTSVR